MPRYEYKCKKCERNFEVTHGVNESVDSCKYCKGEVRRVFHPVGIVFKGSGFYATDSRRKTMESTLPPKSDKKETDSADKESSGNGKDPESKNKKPEKAESADTSSKK